jgi:hypothetical protein
LGEGVGGWWEEFVLLILVGFLNFLYLIHKFGPNRPWGSSFVHAWICT